MPAEAATLNGSYRPIADNQLTHSYALCEIQNLILESQGEKGRD
jgi:hypothetical protein